MFSERSLAKLVATMSPEVAADAALAGLVARWDDDVFDPCSCAVSIYRLGNAVLAAGSATTADLLKTLAFLQRQIAGCEIYFSSRIGANFLLVHGFGTVIGSRVVCGNDVTVYHNVTVGALYDTAKEKPTIGDGTIIYAGAKVLGGIHVGSHVVIGADSLVTEDIPDRAIVAGNPMRIIGFRDDPYHDKYKLPPGVR